MHSQYLRSCCIDNDLAEGRFAFEGDPVSLRDIRLPVFGVGTLTDQAAPWLVAQGSGRQVDARVPPVDADLGAAPGRYVQVRYGD